MYRALCLMPRSAISGVLLWACDFSTQKVKEKLPKVLGLPPCLPGKVKATWDG